MGMKRTSRVAVAAILAVALAACTGGDGEHATGSTRPERTSPTTAADRAGALAPAGVLAARIELSSRRVTGGASIAGTVVVTNRTGHTVTAVGCGSLFAVSLTNDSVAPNTNRLACRQEFTIAEDESRYPVVVRADYPSCTTGDSPGFPTCLPGTGFRPLPAGTYRAVLVQPGEIVPPPRGITVTVV
jgi:hypothetical protein